MEFGIFGLFEVVENGELFDFGLYKQWFFFVLFFINVNCIVIIDCIFEELWGDEVDGKENVLWVYILWI